MVSATGDYLVEMKESGKAFETVVEMVACLVG